MPIVVSFRLVLSFMIAVGFVPFSVACFGFTISILMKLDFDIQVNKNKKEDGAT